MNLLPRSRQVVGADAAVSDVARRVELLDLNARYACDSRAGIVPLLREPDERRAGVARAARDRTVEPALVGAPRVGRVVLALRRQRAVVEPRDFVRMRSARTVRPLLVVEDVGAGPIGLLARERVFIFATAAAENQCRKEECAHLRSLGRRRTDCNAERVNR